MRASSSYRASRKKMAKEAGIPLQRLNQAYDVAARAAEAAPAGEGEDAARKKLAIWAAKGGRETAISPPASDAVLKRLNEGATHLVLQTTPPDQAVEAPAEVTVEAATEAAKKLTVEDIDKAMENALSRWQNAQHQSPMPINAVFAARARVLGWIEGVEFVEED